MRTELANFFQEFDQKSRGEQDWKFKRALKRLLSKHKMRQAMSYEFEHNKILNDWKQRIAWEKNL